MENLYLLDPHIHTAGISLCSRMAPKELVELCLRDGLGGIVLTNHYKSPYVQGTFEEWRQRYVDEYEETRAIGESAGLRVFFGVEFTLDCMMRNDFTVYGLSTDDILEAPALYTLSLPQLADYVHSKNALLYHAHPFRNTVPVDGRYLDGTEINCHPLYRTCAEKRVREFADRYGLRISCGSDYHGDTYKARCGMLIPESVDSTEKFTEFLRENKRPTLVVAPDPTPDMDIGPGKGGIIRSNGI